MSDYPLDLHIMVIGARGSTMVWGGPSPASNIVFVMRCAIGVPWHAFVGNRSHLAALDIQRRYMAKALRVWRQSSPSDRQGVLL